MLFASAIDIRNVHLYSERAYCRKHIKAPHKAEVWERWGGAGGSKSPSIA